MENKIGQIKTGFEMCWEDKARGLDWIAGNSLIEHPEFGGRESHFRSLLYTLIKMLRPENVLEIGSWHYDGSNIMGLAMQDFGVDGKIVSFDIRKGGYDGLTSLIRYSNITGMYWYPHHTSYDGWKYSVDGIVYPNFASMTDEEIFTENKKILEAISPKEGYDLIVIDGDHSYEGVEFDWKYAMLFSHNTTVIVFDDIYDNRHTQVRKFWDGLNTCKYDFLDWNRKHENNFIGNGITLRSIDGT